MKKFFMFAAMASVALVSCVKNEPATVMADQDEVTFEVPVLAPAVKSVDETVEGAFDSDFKVWGYFTEAQQTAFAPSALYMNGVNIELTTEGVWKSSEGKYYWPNNGYLTFVGYAPSDANGAYAVGNNGLNITGYTVDSDAAEDLLVSKISYNNTKLTSANNHDTEAYSNGAEIVFEHALSSIQFTVKTTADIVDNNYTLVVKKITILDAESKGDFAQVLDGTSHQMEASEAANDGWSPKNVPADYVAYDGTGLTLTKDAQYTNGVAAQTENKTDLILLPQVIGDDVKLEVQYTLKNTSMGAADPILQTTTVDLNETTVLQWLRGKRYTYNLTIKLDEITFDPEVSAWVAGAEQENDVTPDYN